MLLTFAITLLSLAQSADTTFTVQRSQRLQVQSHAGDVTVRTWTRSEVRVGRVRCEVAALLGRERDILVSTRRFPRALPAEEMVTSSFPYASQSCFLGSNPYPNWA